MEVKGDEVEEEASKSLNGRLLQYRERGRRPSIFKVHHQFLSGINDDNAQEPKMVAIGPYHHGKHGLKMMEEHKVWYLKLLLLRKNECVDRYISAVADIEEEARSCYAEDLSHLSSDEFTQMLVLDGCFIIELLRRSQLDPDPSDTVFQMKWILGILKLDLILFENQIPFFVLCKLFDLIRDEEETNQCGGGLMNSFFSFWGLKELYGSKGVMNVKPEEVRHLLHLTHATLIPSSDVNFKRESRLIPSATKLKDANVIDVSPCPEQNESHATLLIPSYDVDDVIPCPEQNESHATLIPSSDFNLLIPSSDVDDVIPCPEQNESHATLIPSSDVDFKRENANVIDVPSAFNLLIPSSDVDDVIPCPENANVIDVPSARENANVIDVLSATELKDANVINVSQWRTCTKVTNLRRRPEANVIDVSQWHTCAKVTNLRRRPEANGNVPQWCAKVTNLRRRPEANVIDVSPCPEQNESHATLLIPSSDVDFERESRLIPSASELEYANVKFRVSKRGRGLFDLDFDKNGVLTLPRLAIGDDTESFYRNLIFYEQYFHDDRATYVTDYVLMMDCLINTAKDVEILSRCGIVVNFIGDNQVAADIINRLTYSAFLSPKNFVYADTFKQINAHHMRLWNKARASLKRDYFNTPWAYISFLAAVFLLILTVAQTIIGAIQL